MRPPRRVDGTTLWIGHTGHLRDPAAVSRLEIEAIVDLAVNERPAVVGREVVHCRFPLVDGAGNTAWMLRAEAVSVAELVRAGRETLVFCGAGMSRSLVLGAAGLALATGGDTEECLRRVVAGGAADVSRGLWMEIVCVVEEVRRQSSC